jgi:hypothetical protein
VPLARCDLLILFCTSALSVQHWINGGGHACLIEAAAEELVQALRLCQRLANDNAVIEVGH